MTETKAIAHPKVRELVALIRDHTTPEDVREGARATLAAMGQKGGHTAAERKRAAKVAREKREAERKLAADRKAYLEATRGS